MSDESTAAAIREGEGEGSKKNGEKSTAADAVHPVDAEVEKDEKDDMIRSGQQQKNDKNDPELRYTDFIAKAQKDQNLEVVNGVPVSQDSLFEVHLPTLSLHPVFWAHTGPRISVLSGTWFATDESRPCSWDLAEETENAYLDIPRTTAEEKLKYSLPARFGAGLGISFEDGEKGRRSRRKLLAGA